MGKMYQAIQAIEIALDNARRAYHNSECWYVEPVDDTYDSPTFEKVLIAGFNEAYALAEEMEEK